MAKRRNEGTRGWLGRRRWTEADASEVLQTLEASGLSPAAFALEHGVDRQRVERWQRKLGGRARLAATSFQEVVLPRLTRSGAPIEIQLRNGRVVRVAQAVDLDLLRHVLAAAEDAC